MRNTFLRGSSVHLFHKFAEFVVGYAALQEGVGPVIAYARHRLIIVK